MDPNAPKETPPEDSAEQGLPVVDAYQQAPANFTPSNSAVRVRKNVPTDSSVQWTDCPKSNFLCPHCGNVVTTITHKEMGTKALVLFCFLLCIFPILSLIVCCSDDCMDVVHICPVDKKVVGVKRW